MRIFTGLAAGLLMAAATPALALTVTATPNLEQAQRLQAQRGGGGGPSLGDTFAGSGRPMDAAGFSTGTQQPYGRGVTTYGFGNVTTTIRTDDGAFYGSSPYRAPRQMAPVLRSPELMQRRR
ncbi:MAG: hypothetical protein DI570_28470 [Phenylobacterium zucineum]|nr:MAG: hypothetical protein DI570_28470 [Phenylobacterium zucineum]